MKPQHALGALIEDTIQRNHWTQESVVERIRRAGFRMSTQNLSRIKNAPVTTLVPDQVRALAAGLQLPTSVVLAAALESMGFASEPPRQSDVEEAARYDHRLTARDRRILAAVVTELLADDEEVMGNAEHPAPTSTTHHATGSGKSQIFAGGDDDAATDGGAEQVVGDRSEDVAQPARARSDASPGQLPVVPLREKRSTGKSGSKGTGGHRTGRR